VKVAHLEEAQEEVEVQDRQEVVVDLDNHSLLPLLKENQT